MRPANHVEEAIQGEWERRALMYLLAGRKHGLHLTAQKMQRLLERSGGCLQLLGTPDEAGGIVFTVVRREPPEGATPDVLYIGLPE